MPRLLLLPLLLGPTFGSFEELGVRQEGYLDGKERGGEPYQHGYCRKYAW
jgi:hypothetical protein